MNNFKSDFFHFLLAYQLLFITTFIFHSKLSRVFTIIIIDHEIFKLYFNISDHSLILSQLFLLYSLLFNQFYIIQFLLSFLIKI